MEEDVLPPFPEEVAVDFMPVDGGIGVREPGPSNQAEVPIQNLDMSDLHEEVPEIEVLRDGVHNFTPEGLPDLAGLDDHPIQDEQSSHTVHGRVSLSPIHEHVSLSEGDFLPSQLPINPPSIPSSRALGDLDLGVPSGTALPDLELQPSPPAVEIARPRRRKREQFFDKSLVLTNECMRKQLQDTSKLIRKSKRLPLSALDVWRYHRIKKVEDVFSKPLISGMCTNLQEAFKKHRIFPMVSEVPLEAPLDAMNEHFPVDVPHIDQSPVGMPHIEQSPTGITPMEIEIEQSPTGMRHMEIEIDQPRFGGHEDGSFHDFMPSPSGRDDATASISNKIGMTSQTGKNLETEIPPSLGTRASYESDFHRSGTLFSVLEEQHQPDFDDNVFPDIPDLQKSADVEDLSFLEADNTPLGHAEDSVHNLSARTRAVAQYLKGKSPAISEDQPGKLSLNRMLEGKARKHCARMFFETMVLKSCDLIDVEQEEAYGDINISLMPALSKANF
ncbi:Sister chromatid cohesion 1 protein 3 [Acorus gramineus]|uniref:Sister chromatid cohesion 1 protein 3 n=1 Tax=Acorus gramineus TaxID=55184 RepID=A0AAV9BLN8_ACOGR|nr:Sister chromatid cohesion 1 protein 3 [Acorus gramineus]